MWRWPLCCCWHGDSWGTDHHVGACWGQFCRSPPNTAFPWGLLDQRGSHWAHQASPASSTASGRLLPWCSPFPLAVSLPQFLSIPGSESFCLPVSPSLSHSPVLYSPTHLSTPCLQLNQSPRPSPTPGFAQLSSAPLETLMPAFRGHRNSPTKLQEHLGSWFIKIGQAKRKGSSAKGTGWGYRLQLPPLWNRGAISSRWSFGEVRVLGKHIVTLVSLSLLCVQLCDNHAGFPFLGAFLPPSGEHITGCLELGSRIRSITMHSDAQCLSLGRCKVNPILLPPSSPSTTSPGTEAQGMWQV